MIDRKQLSLGRAAEILSPLSLEVLSLAALLVREVNRLNRIALADGPAGPRVLALSEAQAALELLLALREGNRFVVLTKLDQVQADMGALEAQFLRDGKYLIADLPPLDRTDAGAIAYLVAPLLARARIGHDPLKPRGRRRRRARIFH